MNSLRPTWAEIDLDAIVHNVRELRNCLTPKTRFMAVIKANAYGHGLVQVARICEREGVDFLGVALLDEACYLRDCGIKTPIMILGYTPVNGAELVVTGGFRQTVYNWEGAESLSQAAVALGKEAVIHIKLDTGMSRIGFLPGEEALHVIEKIAALPNLVIEGVFTHFAQADSLDRSFTYLQLERFHQFLEGLDCLGIRIPIRHAANSAGIIQFPEAHLDMVRAGVSLYGLRPSPELDIKGLQLIPAMRLISRVVMVKEIPASTPISYGGTYLTPEPTKVATVPVGYGDGYTRFYSNCAWASVKGRPVPLIGRVCMDQCMFDVSEVEEVKIGDEVILFGRPGDGITADDLARITGTINYEVICLINSRVPRCYIGQAEPENS